MFWDIKDPDRSEGCEQNKRITKGAERGNPKGSFAGQVPSASQ